MADYLFDQRKAKRQLLSFFRTQKVGINSFGSAVNQTFEAYVFAEVIKYYKRKGYSARIINPRLKKKNVFRLKFSTRGAPRKYSYVLLSLNKETIQLRHQLRVSTVAHRKSQVFNANICCDITIMGNYDLSKFSTDDAIPSNWLISFGEVKHMSAFAELVASHWIGS